MNAHCERFNRTLQEQLGDSLATYVLSGVSTDEFLGTHSNVQPHFPDRSSWLNHVGLWFAETERGTWIAPRAIHLWSGPQTQADALHRRMQQDGKTL